MIERISREDRESLKRFFPGTGDVLLLSALEGFTGRAFESRDGAAAIVVSRGFVFLGGQAKEAFFRRAAAYLPDCFLTFRGSPAWLRIARRCGASVAMTRYEMAAPERFDEALLRRLAHPPEGFVLKTADESVYRDCLSAPWSEDLASFYSDAASFVRDDLVFAAYRDGELAAGCGVYARTADAVEIEIDTRESFRRMGLATCCAAAFLLRCVQRGLTPHWDAMTPISRALAMKLGFADPRPYQVVCREEIHGSRR